MLLLYFLMLHVRVMTILSDNHIKIMSSLQLAAGAASISFLFLTYGAIVHETAIRKFTDHHRVFIHPKYPELVQPHFRQYIISDRIEDTEWGSIRIVDATVNLLRAALASSPPGQWFILLSQDVFPMVSEPELCEFLATQTLSMFHTTSSIVDTKASQWWIMNRSDAALIVKRYAEYRRLFVKKSSMQRRRDATPNGAPDELFFLGCLRQYSSAHYTNRVSVYDQWLTHTIQKSPATFRRLTASDMHHVSGALFVRKTFDHFDPVVVRSTTTHQRQLVVVYVGTESRQEYGKLCRMVDADLLDVIVLSAIPVPQINAELLQRCLCVHSIIWKFALESMMNVTVAACTTWDQIILLSETFCSDDVDTTTTTMTTTTTAAPIMPGVKRTFSHPLPFEPLYVHVMDRARQSAWVFTASGEKGGAVKTDPRPDPCWCCCSEDAAPMEIARNNNLPHITTQCRQLLLLLPPPS